MRLTLHIGIHKTGSTALQHFLSMNRKLLRGEGILYPRAGCPSDAGTRHAHHLLPWSLLSPGRPANAWRRINRELVESGCEHAIVSSEDFSRLRSRRQFDRLASQLEEFDVRVVAYLRRQDEYLHALYCTRVLFDDETADFEEFAGGVADDAYVQILRPWEESFGREALTVRAYERRRLSGGDIITDFFDLLGLRIPSAAVREDEADLVNRSLPRNVVNGVLELRRAGVPAAEITALAEMLVHHAYRGQRTEADMASPAQRTRILKRFEAANRTIAERYLEREDGVLFEDLAVPDQAAWQERYEGPHADLVTSIRDARQALGMDPGSTLAVRAPTRPPGRAGRKLSRGGPRRPASDAGAGRRTPGS